MVKVLKQANWPVINLPKDVVQFLKIDFGDTLEFKIENGRVEMINNGKPKEVT